MGVITDTLEITSSIPPSRLFKAFILDINLLPKLLPNVFKSIQNIEGNGGVGTVRLLTFFEGGQVKTAKHRTDELDETNHVYKFTSLEGGILDGDIESNSNSIKIEPGPNGGSIYKGVFTYHTKGENHHSIQEKIKQGKEGVKSFFQAVEAHLHAHPHEYK